MIRVPLSRGLFALVDDADAEIVLSLGKWYANPSRGTFYARKNFNRQGRFWSVRMHSLLTGWDLVDHANGDGLDNRRGNLRQATNAQNAANRRRRSDNTSGFKGVSRHCEKWAAELNAQGRHVWLGLHDDSTTAALAYDEAALRHFGEFARLNFPLKETP